MVRWCWVNFQYWDVLLIWITVGQGPAALAVAACGVVWTFFSLEYHFSFVSPSLWETAQYRLKYCLKGPLKKQNQKKKPKKKNKNNQPTTWLNNGSKRGELEIVLSAFSLSLQINYSI